MKLLTTVGVLLCAAYMSLVPQALAKDISGIYSPTVLAHWQPVLERWINALIEQEISPALWPAAKQALQNSVIDVPLASPSNDPFTYYVKGHTLTIPVLSVKLLYDLTAAQTWLALHGFDDKTLFYVLALKYQDASAFPGGRYLSPLEALGVPHNSAMELTDTDPQFSHAFQQTFNGALLFLVAHEIGHLVPQATDHMTATEHEAAADLFAFAILTRSQFSPAGVLLLFTYLSVWVPNAADFETNQDYLQSIENDPHPLTAARLIFVGTQLVDDPHRFYPGVADSDPRIPLLKLLGAKLIEAGNALNDLISKKVMRDVAKEVQIPSLAIHEQSNGHNAPAVPK
jgi:hypothetical protein